MRQTEGVYYLQNNTMATEMVKNWLLPTLITFGFAWYCAPIAAWGPDQSITYLQAAQFVDGEGFPRIGLINSVGHRNPNALVLISAPFVFLANSPQTISILLAFFQGLIIIGCWNIYLKSLHCRPGIFLRLCFLPVLLWAPENIFTTTELWAQYLCRTFLCVFVILLLKLKSDTLGLKAISFGFFLLFLPAVHLALIVPVLLAAGYFIVLVKEKKAHWVPCFSGAFIGFLISWFPWLLYNSNRIDKFVHKASIPASTEAVLFYAATPFISLFHLLLDAQLLQSRGSILAESTESLLNLNGVWRLLMVLLCLLFLLWTYYKRRSPQVLRVLLLTLCILIIFSIYACFGRAPYSIRPDFGLMFVQPLLLVIFGVAVKNLVLYQGWFRRSNKQNHGSKITVGAAIFLVIGSLLTGLCSSRVVHDSIDAVKFTVADIPVYEKIAAMNAIHDDNKDQNQVIKVAYKVAGYDREYSWVKDFQLKGGAKDYMPEALLHTYHYRKSHQEIRFVGVNNDADYLIIHPLVDQQFQVPIGNNILRPYEQIMAGKYLGVWKKVSSRK